MHREIVKLSKNKSLTILLPPEFKDSKKVVVTIEEYSEEEKKIDLGEAINDPMFIQNLKEVNDDFSAMEHETQ